MKNAAYQVMHIETYTTVCGPMGEHAVELLWADGMLGVSPIFASREQAEAYADGHDVVEINCLPLEDEAP